MVGTNNPLISHVIFTIPFHVRSHRGTEAHYIDASTAVETLHFEC